MNTYLVLTWFLWDSPDGQLASCHPLRYPAEKELTEVTKKAREHWQNLAPTAEYWRTEIVTENYDDTRILIDDGPVIK